MTTMIGPMAAVLFLIAAWAPATDAQATCTATWASVGSAYKYGDMVRLALYKSQASFSDPSQLPAGWNGGLPALTGYVINHLGATLAVSGLWTTSGSYYYVQTATAYPSGTGALTLTYPCLATPAPTPLPPTPQPPTPVPPTPQPPTPVPPPTPPPITCTAVWASVGSAYKYGDMVRLALYKTQASFSDPSQPPAGWNGGLPALPGYVINHLGATLAVSGLWTTSDAYYYYVQTATAYPSGTGPLTLTYPCLATPAPTPLPPTPQPPTPEPPTPQPPTPEPPTPQPPTPEPPTPQPPTPQPPTPEPPTPQPPTPEPPTPQPPTPQPPTPQPPTPEPTPVPPPTPTTCTATWASVGAGFKYGDMVRLGLYKSQASFSNPSQLPAGWNGGLPALPGYVIDHLGATLAVSGLFTTADAYYYYVQTATAYPSGTGPLTLTYPC